MFNSPEIQAIIFIVIGLLIIIGGFSQLNKRKKILANGIEVEGVIFELIYDNNGSESQEYPVIRFVTKDKNMTWITEKYEVSMPGLRTIGKKVQVVYNADNPKEFIVKTSFDTSSLYYALPVIGIVLMGIGIIMAISYLLHGN